MKNKTIWLVLGVVVVAIVAIVAVQQTRQPKEEKVIKIGAILPLTGAAAEFGKYNIETTNLVIEEFTKKTGIQVKLYVEDSKSSPKDGANAYRALMLRDPEIQIISSELSSVCMSLVPLTEKQKQLLMAIAATPKLNEYSRVLRIYPRADNLAEAFHKAILKILSSHNSQVVIFYIDDEFGRSVSEQTRPRLSQQGYNVLTEAFSKNTDIRSIVAKYRGSNVYIVVGYGSTMGLVIREIRRMSSTSPIIASPEMNFNDVLSLLTLPDENLYYIDIAPPSEEIDRLFHTQVSRSPNLVDLLVFDGLNIVLQAAEKILREKKSFTADDLVARIKESEFTFYGRSLSVDQAGNIQYKLLLRKVDTFRR
ncbi:MAG: ABC transporter substrate-binding protein [Candidatus Caldarchaeum sp.]